MESVRGVDDRLLDDGDFDYEEVNPVPASSSSLSRPQIVSNLPYDEEISLSDSDVQGDTTDAASDEGIVIRREPPISTSKPDMKTDPGFMADPGLDEAALESSEPTILRRILRNTMKGTAALEVNEKPGEGIGHDDKKRDAKIDAWIASVEQLREVENTGEFKPKNRFPTLDTLMQVWPEELEPLVKNLHVSNAHVPVELNTLCRSLCNVLDIPVYDDLLESLHWLFMLFLELKHSEQVDPLDTTVSAEQGANFFAS